ncbi:MAG TPA: hypothetical protein VF111_01650 [Thermoanaerobaculia bacterium]
MDPILYWNGVSLEANRVSHTNDKMEQTGPPLSARALAIVHLAMYDAFAATTTVGLPPYLPALPLPPAGATAEAAVAGAAHAALQALFPSQQDFLDARLSEAGDVLDPGHDFGVCVARAILADRANDPNAGAAGYTPSFARYRHRVDPDNPKQGYHAPFYGARSKGFAITQRWELDSPATLTPAEYIEAVREVRGKGIAPELAGTIPSGFAPRRPDEYLAGIYWAYDGAVGLGTPPRLYNQIIRLIAIRRNNDAASNARLFALVNVAMADAGILAWDQKYIHEFWRPVLGIREHDESMGVAARPQDAISIVTDPGWLPLGAPATNSMNQSFAQPVSQVYPHNQAIVGRFKNFTPNFPAYPSGHATFGAAAFQITRLFYNIPRDQVGDDLFDGLAFVSDEFNGVNQDNRGTIRPRHLRSFPRGLWDMIIENGLSRVWLGVHWAFDAFVRQYANDDEPDLERNIGGVPLGIRIAEDIFDSNMQPSGVGPRTTPPPCLEPVLPSGS